MQRERPPRRVEVRDQQAATGLGHPVHLAERGRPLPGRDMVDRERAGDHVERRIEHAVTALALKALAPAGSRL
jgi:hypothetical protein